MGLTGCHQGVGRAEFLPGGSEGSHFLFQRLEAARIRDPLSPSLKAAMVHTFPKLSTHSAVISL